MLTKISYAVAFLIGLGLIFIGARFLWSPEIAEAGYGIHFNNQGDYSFHYIKGIRDIFSGIMMCAFVLMNERRALAVTLIAGIIIPVTDMLIVLSKSYSGVPQAMPHIIAIIICALLGVILLLTKTKKLNVIKTKGYVTLSSTAKTGNQSVMELNILPGEKTPWHYHTLFAETFEVLQGSLEVGKGKDIYELKHGDSATVEPNEKHYYHNVSNEECIIRVTLNPGNENFENAISILKGLANDGFATKAGTPRKFSDLVLFVYLSNSRMVGFQKIAEPIFTFFAKAAIKRGYLKELMLRYGKVVSDIDMHKLRT